MMPSRWALGQFRRDPLGLMLQSACSDVALIQFLPGVYSYIVSHPDLIHDILVKRASSFDKPAALKQVMGAFFGNGLFLADNALHRQQRPLIQPAFHHQRIATYADLMVRHTQKQLDSWQPNTTRQIDSDMRALTLDIIVSSMFSADVTAATQSIAVAMHDLSETSREQGFNPLKAMFPDWLPTPFNRRKLRGVRVLDAIIRQIIDSHPGTDTGDLLSLLLLAQDESGQPMSRDQVRDEVFTIFIAGHETTSNLLAWVWVLLAQHPQVEAHLHSELDAVLAGRAPTFADLGNLSYTASIISEALRLYPPVWVILRQVVVNSIEIGGHTLKRGTQLLLSPYAVHHDSRWYDSPHSFQPERFTPEFEKSLPRFAYFPFGGGARVCIGNGFALLEAQLILATIAQRYRLRLDQPVKPLVGVTLAVPNGLSMRLASR